MRHYSGRLVALLTRLTAFNYLRPLFERPYVGIVSRSPKRNKLPSAAIFS